VWYNIKYLDWFHIDYVSDTTTHTPPQANLLPLQKNSIMKFAIFATLTATVAAFVPSAPMKTTPVTSSLNMDRRSVFAPIAGAAVAFGIAAPALAVRDYDNVGLLGGGSVVDVNNANIRVYLKMPGMYPNVAGKIVTNGPYSSVNDLYNIKGLTGAEKDMIKKYESRFTAQTPSADYVIDRYNNGLYR